MKFNVPVQKVPFLLLVFIQNDQAYHILAMLHYFFGSQEFINVQVLILLFFFFAIRTPKNNYNYDWNSQNPTVDDPTKNSILYYKCYDHIYCRPHIYASQHTVVGPNIKVIERPEYVYRVECQQPANEKSTNRYDT